MNSVEQASWINKSQPGLFRWLLSRYSIASRILLDGAYLWLHGEQIWSVEKDGSIQFYKPTGYYILWVNPGAEKESRYFPHIVSGGMIFCFTDDKWWEKMYHPEAVNEWFLEQTTYVSVAHYVGKSQIDRILFQAILRYLTSNSDSKTERLLTLLSQPVYQVTKRWHQRVYIGERDDIEYLESANFSQ